jgi:hypothetical protein
MFTKRILQPEVGFDPTNISYASFAVVNFIILCVAIPYWARAGFNEDLFWTGSIAGVFNTIGLVLL